MAVALRSYTNEASGDPIATPDGTMVGDVLLAMIDLGGSTPDPTPPAGWTLVRTVSTGTTSADRKTHVYVYPVLSTPPATHEFGAYYGGFIACFSGGDPADPVNGSSVGSYNGSSTTTVTAASITTTKDNAHLALFALMDYAGTSWSPPAGMTERFDGAVRTGFMLLADQPWPAAGATGTRTATASAAAQRDKTAVMVALNPDPNRAPNAPILTTPADASTIDRTATQRFDWDFSDPDAGDTQSAYNLRYRVVGAATWTETGWVSTPNTYHDVAGGTFADAVDYEWQVATKDAQGVAGPYSTSSFFTAGTAPTAPTITAPTNGGTYLQNETVSWSTPNQDAYQLRVLDEVDAVVYDTGTVESAGTRSLLIELPDNETTRTIQVRVRDGGLWSQYAEVTGTVSWLAPPVPTFTITEDPAEGALVVSISNPAPAGAEPAAVYNDVYVTDPGKAEQRRATMVAVNGSWTYHLPVGRYSYDGSDGSDIRVVSVAENGVTSST